MNRTVGVRGVMRWCGPYDVLPYGVFRYGVFSYDVLPHQLTDGVGRPTVALQQ
ncbi:hypothetical protein O1M63_23630 [Streptomyces mirabilis]|nr:hypothetical protein [Streptomyces mirabilis]